MTPEVGYEARYGPSARNVLLVIVSLAFVVVIPLIHLEIVLAVLGEILFGAGFLLFLAMSVLRRVALRVDELGIAVTKNPFQPESKWLSARWPEVEAIVLWEQPVGSWSMRQIGIRRCGDAPAGLTKTSRPVNGWRLDRERLVAAVRRFAPEVEIVDLG